MLLFFSREKEYHILERNVDAVDIITNKYVINIRKSGVRIVTKEPIPSGIEKEVVPLYDEHLDLT